MSNCYVFAGTLATYIPIVLTGITKKLVAYLPIAKVLRSNFECTQIVLSELLQAEYLPTLSLYAIQVFVTVPTPEPGDPEWGVIATNAENYAVEIRIPSNIKLHSHPTQASEGVSFSDTSIRLVNTEVSPGLV